jgi:hypothetical protein
MEWAKLAVEALSNLAWPVAAIVIVLLFRRPLVGIIPGLRKVELPGGVKLDIEGVQQLEAGLERAEESLASAQEAVDAEDDARAQAELEATKAQLGRLQDIIVRMRADYMSVQDKLRTTQNELSVVQDEATRLALALNDERHRNRRPWNRRLILDDALTPPGGRSNDG